MEQQVALVFKVLKVAQVLLVFKDLKGLLDWGRQVALVFKVLLVFKAVQVHSAQQVI
jgi:type IV secretory pathway VirB2 component (pilin)